MVTATSDRIRDLIAAHAKASMDGFQERHAAHIASLRDDDGSMFYPCSLGHWLQACQRAGVPYVPAEKIADCATLSVWEFDQKNEINDRELGGMMDSIRNGLKDRHMMRWDCCAPAEVKDRLGSGQSEWDESLVKYFSPDDPRAYDIIQEYPFKRISVWQRPWIQARIEAGYPVEYRVFIQDGEVIGVCNYYPQRPLPDTRLVRAEARLAEAYADVLIANICEPMLMPEFIESDRSKVQGTMDFMATGSGLLFLEGGPPHTPRWGAHPCCFKVGEISGVALSDRN